jgi:serine/threonine-protein kinase HipA
MARTLDVFLNADLVGCLAQDDSGNLGFRYDAAWLGASHSVPLSASLPLKAAAFTRRECRPFFAGLLPEEIQRKLIAQSFGVSERNDFSLLDKIGGECAGAVSLMPPGQKPDATMWTSQPLTQEELAFKLAELPKKPLLAGDRGLRLSLAGAQSKMAVVLENGQYAIPLNGAPSSHIIKPQSPRFDHLVENEFFCMRLAAAVGLNVAPVEMGQAGEQSFLQITRYDRHQETDGTLSRIHQEDFCQALGCVPEQKYQQEGGPGLRQCFELIRSVSSAPAVDLLQLFDAVVFNFLIGNGDAHGKNFSILYTQGKARLAPFYDLICTQAYSDLDQSFAMKIGKERDPGKIRLKDWQLFINETGLNLSAALRRIKSIADRVEGSLGKGSERLPGQQTVTNCVKANCTRLREALG